MPSYIGHWFCVFYMPHSEKKILVDPVSNNSFSCFCPHSTKGLTMRDFLIDLMIYTGGVATLLFLIIMVIGFCVEIYDRISGADEKRQARINQKEL